MVRQLSRWLIVFSLVGWLVGGAQAQRQAHSSIWDVAGIYQVPAYRISARDSVISLIYKGLSYQGQAANVFAYYASPATLAMETHPHIKFPGIVLVHGGGGRAFKEWAIMWAKKGYAAIAMDLRGNGPDGKHIKGGFVEQGGKTPYFKITPALNNQWMFQAVADVILAHNLLRSFPEVDSFHIALTGISWGGVIACDVAGLDDRFKAVVPVYGCGYLWESGRMKSQLDALSAADRAAWVRQYDPSRYLKKAMMAILLLNDAQDPYFVLSSYMKTYRDVKRANLCIKTDLRHSHRAGWSNEEIFYFVNHYIHGTKGLAFVGGPRLVNNQVTAKLTAPVKIEKGWLYYTADTSALGESRKWTKINAAAAKHRVISPMPPSDATMYYFSVEDIRGLQSSGEVRFGPLQN